MSHLEGRTFLITGIADDKSLAMFVARALADAGAKLVCTGLGLTEHHADLSARSRAFLARSWEFFESSVGAVLPGARCLPMDVTVEASVEALARALEGTRVDGVLHSIAMDKTIRGGTVKPLLDVTRDEFMNAMDVSAYSLIAVCRHLVAQDRLAAGGSVVALSYRGAGFVMGHPYRNMGVAKAALERIVTELADELGRRSGVRVNGVRFSPYDGSRAGGAIPGLDAYMRQAEEKSPLGNARPEDLAAEVVHLLTSPGRSTGEIRNVDGGYHIQG